MIDIRPSLCCVVVVGIMFLYYTKQNEYMEKKQIAVGTGARAVENGCVYFHLCLICSIHSIRTIK